MADSSKTEAVAALLQAGPMRDLNEQFELYLSDLNRFRGKHLAESGLTLEHLVEPPPETSREDLKPHLEAVRVSHQCDKQFPRFAEWLVYQAVVRTTYPEEPRDKWGALQQLASELVQSGHAEVELQREMEEDRSHAWVEHRPTGKETLTIVFTPQT